MAKKTQLLYSGNPPSTEAGEQDVADEPTLVDQGMPTRLMLERRERARRCADCGGFYSFDEQFCPLDGTKLEDEPTYSRGDDPLIGLTLAERYIVEEVIAEGGMGTVYRVRHAKLKSHFAMKVLRRDLAEDTMIADRLIDEARNTAAIGHPNIVAAADFGEIDSSHVPELGKLKLPFFVMEHLSGYTLAELVEEVGALHPERVASIIVQVASALAAAHREGIIHRDLKPDNIRLVRDESGNEMAKVVDFGVAKVIGASRQTQKGIVFGTPHYMSPEQGQGDPIDHRTDIYALGVIIYECLMGEVPFVADTFVGIITKHIHAVPPPLAKALRKTNLAAVMNRCLQKHPDARFEAMTDIVEELSRGTARARANSHAGSVMHIAGERDQSTWLWVVAAVSTLVAIFVAVRYLPAEEHASERPAAASAAPAIESASQVNKSDPVPTVSAAASAVEPPPPVPPIGQPPPPASPPRPSAQPSKSATPAAPIRPRPLPRPKPAGDVVDPWG